MTNAVNSFFQIISGKNINQMPSGAVGHKGSSDSSFSILVNQQLNSLGYINPKGEKGQSEITDVNSLLEKLDQLLNSENVDLVIPELKTILTELLSFIQGEGKLSLTSSNLDNASFASIANGNSTIPLTLNMKKLTTDLKATSNDITQIANLLLTKVMSLYEKVLNTPKPNQVVMNKMDLLIGKLAELQQSNPELAKTLMKTTEGTKFEKLWQEIVGNVKQLANNSLGKGNTFLPEQRLQNIVSQVMRGLPTQRVEGTNDTSTTGLEAMPMSKIEQYTLYVNRSQGPDSSTTQNQLMDQFEQVIKESKFVQKEGALQLTLKLKPAHLGEMIVKFTQINGEMAVKILVSTQGVKEMLESNLHQLRSMFSPSQVIIEKQPESVMSQDLPSYFNFDEGNQEKEQKSKDSDAFDKDFEEDNYENNELTFKEVLSKL